MCRNSRFFLALILFLVAHNAYGQQETYFDVSAVPTFGFNVSYSSFSRGYQHTGYHAISAQASTKDVYYGLGLQFRYLEDWQLTVRYAGSALGAGFRKQAIYLPDVQYEKGRDLTSTPVKMLDATIEKKVVTAYFLKKQPVACKTDISLIAGMRYTSLLKADRTDSLVRLPSLSTSAMKIAGYEKQYRNGGAAVSAGVSAQLSIGNHRSLKLGVMYSYLLKPIIEYQFKITSYTYDNNAYQTHNDEFNLIPGRNQVLFFAEYPIRLLRINAAGTKQ